MLQFPAEVLGWDAIRIAASVLIISAGLVYCAIFFLRSRVNDRSSLYFGIAALIYGLRLVSELELLRLQYPAFPWTRIEWSFTSVMPIPFTLYFGATIARAYPRLVRTLLAVEAVVTSFGLVTQILDRPRGPASVANAWMGVILVMCMFVCVFRPKLPIDREVRVLRLAMVVLGAFSLFSNLVSIRVLSGNGEYEIFALLFFLACLGYVSAHRILRNEQRLSALDHELEIARRIQSGLLPKLDRTSSQLEIQARYVPLANVAGDFYDVLHTDSGVGVLIADVSGHGVPAALSASMVKVALRAQLPHGSDPAKVLSGLNAALNGVLDGQFVTAAYVFFETAAQRIHYGGAGHPPLLIFRSASSKVEAVENNGLFLGPFDAAQYSSITLPFATSDRCVLYTDGIVEAENASGEQFGLERLSSLVADSTAAPDQLSDAILAAVRGWSAGAETSDDMTLVIVEAASASKVLTAGTPKFA